MSKRLYARGALVTWAWAQRSTHTHTHRYTDSVQRMQLVSLSQIICLSLCLPLSLSLSLLVLKFDFLSHKPLVTLAFRIDLPIHNCHTAWLKFYLFIIIFPHIFYCCSLSLSPPSSLSLLLRWLLLSYKQIGPLRMRIASSLCRSPSLSLSLFWKGKVSSLKLASIDFESCIKMQFGQKQQRKKNPKKKSSCKSLSRKFGRKMTWQQVHFLIWIIKKYLRFFFYGKLELCMTRLFLGLVWLAAKQLVMT